MKKKKRVIVVRPGCRDFGQLPPDPTDATKSPDGLELTWGNLKDNAQSLHVKEPTFPVKLHMILSNLAFESIVAWQPHGRAWRIIQQKDFEKTIIPLYFSHSSFSSFTRQVSGWDFTRIRSGADFSSYYHQLFIRGKGHLCHKMKRLVAKDMVARKTRKEQGYEQPLPDFCSLARSNELNEASLPDKETPQAASSTVAGLTGADETQAELDQLSVRLDLIENLMNDVKANALDQAAQARSTNAFQLSNATNSSLRMSDASMLLASITPLGQVTAQQILAAISPASSAIPNNTEASASLNNVQQLGLGPTHAGHKSQGPTTLPLHVLSQMALELRSSLHRASSNPTLHAQAPFGANVLLDSANATMQRNLLAHLLQGRHAIATHQGMASHLQQLPPAPFPVAWSSSQAGAWQARKYSSFNSDSSERRSSLPWYCWLEVAINSNRTTADKRERGRCSPHSHPRTILFL